MKVKADLHHRFIEKTAASRQWFERAQKVIPGGVTANIKYFDPYPLVMASGSGARLIDTDGNRYIDYNLCYGALMLGHGHPVIQKAVNEQWDQMGTTVTGTPHYLEVEMAEKLVSLYPGMDQVRFTNSGLEATMFALRLATAWRGRNTIAKCSGHYHGGYDQVLVSVQQGEVDENGFPAVTADSKGLSAYWRENTVVLPFNDWERTEALLIRNHERLGAVILEPVQSGFLPPERDYLLRLREFTTLYGIPLIFDEVKTGFRLGLSGAQGRYGVIPDLTALGKVLGGGFPVGAVGGRQEIMEICSPTEKGDILTLGRSGHGEDVLFHSGTYNGHPSVMAAGMATIRVLEEPGVYERVEQEAFFLRQGMEEILDRHGVPGYTMGDGTIFNLVMPTDKGYRSTNLLQGDKTLRQRLDFALLEEGIYLKPMSRFSLSTAHTHEVVKETLTLFEEGVKKIK
ncbi:aspartate aminotransferase family protein [Desmospora activa]|uniref:Glutamate-1-semialdehyde 2,1-aminomutase n=1 Tax=Desmospora activa DSM 45169 TaxID=1121389 RepID=A0A2T4ZB02_9BACL|nr:aspartate aminotransferase family protein [Desmospora activa]PTM59069.1 glutamate-1-semialdehyde 2,1-aminomutase [Desmospora activa DSM 45169]